tara:strand:+ start:718 stop:1107 length:390 start_codon:yes stop_codon:yes gene_type:complete
MATTNKAPKAPTIKRTAPLATAATGSGTVATTQTPVGSKAAQASTPQAPLFTAGTMPPVRPGTHRHYAQQVAVALAKDSKAGFTLAEFKVALVAGAAASSVAPPRGGWAAHNMPTWMANINQSWLVAVK